MTNTERTTTTFVATKVRDIPVGAYVTIPTSHSGTHTGILIARRALGPYAAAGDFMATIQYDNGTQQEVRTNDAYSGWVDYDVPAQQVVTIPAAALRPGHVIVGHRSRHLVESVRVSGGMYRLNTRQTDDGTEERGLPMGPDATVRVVVTVPA